MAEARTSVATYDAVNQARSQLAQVRAAYMQWKLGQDQRIANLERQLTELKLQLDEDLMIHAGLNASAIAQAQARVEAYAQAVARAIAATENPHTYSRTPAADTAPAPAPLSLPG